MNWPDRIYCDYYSECWVLSDLMFVICYCKSTTEHNMESNGVNSQERPGKSTSIFLQIIGSPYFSANKLVSSVIRCNIIWSKLRAFTSAQKMKSILTEKKKFWQFLSYRYLIHWLSKFFSLIFSIMRLSLK